MPLEQSDLDQIKDLFSELLTDAEKRIVASAHQADSKTAASLSREFKKMLDTTIEAIAPPAAEAEPEKEAPKPAPSDTDGDSGRLSLKALQTQIKTLQTQITESQQAIAERDRRIAEARKREDLNKAIVGQNIAQVNAASDLLWYRYGDKIQAEGDRHFIQDGETVIPLEDMVKSFASSDEGKAFLPPSGIVGSGATETPPETTVTPPAPPASTPKADEALMAAFAE